MSSLLEMNVLDTPDLEIQKEGEYKIHLIKAAVGTSKNGNVGLILLFDLPEIPNGKLVNHWLGLEPAEDATIKQKQDAQRRIKDFLLAFGFEQQPLNEAYAAQKQMPADKGTIIEDWANAEGYAILSIQPADGQYEASNKIARFVVSR